MTSKSTLAGTAAPRKPSERRHRSIAFVGAHGTGKTTLARQVESKLLDEGLSVRLVPEIPRIVCEQARDPEFFRRGHNSVTKQILLLAGQPIYDAEAASQADIVISDRSLLDHWAYTTFLFGSELRKEGIFDPLDALVRTYCELYDAIFYVPIEFPAIDDGTRESDPDFQEGIAREMESHLARLNLMSTRVIGSVEERAATVLGHISLKSATEDLGGIS